MKAHFNIYGLPIELSADHPLVFDAFREDLRYFQTRRKGASREVVRVSIAALPASLNGDGYPAVFAPYQAKETRISLSPDTTLTRYWKSAITVLSHFKKRHIQAGVIPEPALLPDPAYHYVFTQPMGLWFKKRGLFFLHAGCVAKGLRGVLIAGGARSGKSTLALSAVRAGFKFLGDEQPLLSLRNNRLVAHAFPRRVRLDRSGAARFRELQGELQSSTFERVCFSIEKIWPERIVPSCLPLLLIFPQFRTRGGLRVARMGPAEALERLLQDDYFIWYRDGPWRHISQQHLALFEHLSKTLAAYHVEYGHRDLPSIPNVFQKLLSTHKA